MSEAFDITMFTENVRSVPMGMFDKYEIEAFMAWFLQQCIDKNDIDAVIKTRANEDYLCDRGILVKVDTQQYRLSESTKKKLYEEYKRMFIEPSDFEV